MKRNTIWLGVSLACYIVSYLLCKFVFYELHYMKQWTNILAVFGLVVLLPALLLKKRGLAVMTVIGYLGGFALGMLFNSDGVDAGGARTNNAWIIWTVAFLISMVIGIIIDISLKIRKQKTS